MSLAAASSDRRPAVGVGDARRRRDVGIGDRHAKPLGAPRDGAADAPEPENAERLAAQARAERQGARAPCAGADMRVAVDHLAHVGEDEREGEVRHVLGENVGRVGDADAAGARALEIDRVDADAVAGDDLELGQRSISAADAPSSPRVAMARASGAASARNASLSAASHSLRRSYSRSSGSMSHSG